MKTFYCDACGALIFFENTKCVQCGHDLGFIADALDMSALEPAGQQGIWRALSAGAKNGQFRLCQNGQSHQACNWLVPANDPNAFCTSCQLNRTIPDLSVTGNRERWLKLEKAKRRLLYTLLTLKLPVTGDPGQNRPPLKFDFLANPPGGPAILTGHEHGLITLNIAEADDSERERRRHDLREPYRTLLGHFRHEVGHYYWDQLIANTPRLPCFRELFGDDSADYGTALKNYHAQGAPADWQTRLISEYASAHPWEDWAESWAHYLHMVDTLETAASFGVSLRPKHPAAKTMSAQPKPATEADADFAKILEAWFPLTYALNTLNRGMGLPDLYPFILSTPAIEKLKFIHETVKAVQNHR